MQYIKTDIRAMVATMGEFRNYADKVVEFIENYGHDEQSVLFPQTHGNGFELNSYGTDLLFKAGNRPDKQIDIFEIAQSVDGFSCLSDCKSLDDTVNHIIQYVRESHNIRDVEYQVEVSKGWVAVKFRIECIGRVAGLSHEMIFEALNDYANTPVSE